MTATYTKDLRCGRGSYSFEGQPNWMDVRDQWGNNFPMSCPKPTPEELDLHRRAVEKLSVHLFEKYAPSDLHIISTLEIVEPSVSQMVYPYGSESRTERRIALGGLKFLVEKGYEAHDLAFTIAHERADVFCIHISVNRVTRVSTTARFKTLPSRVYDLVQACRRNKVRAR